MLVTACRGQTQQRGTSVREDRTGADFRGVSELRLVHGSDRMPYLLPVLFILDGVHRAARLGIQHEVKAGVFAEAAGITQEGVLLVVIDGP